MEQGGEGQQNFNTYVVNLSEILKVQNPVQCLATWNNFRFQVLTANNTVQQLSFRVKIFHCF